MLWIVMGWNFFVFSKQKKRSNHVCTNKWILNENEYQKNT